MRENGRVIVGTVVMLSVTATLAACADGAEPVDETPAGGTSAVTSPIEEAAPAPTPSPDDADEMDAPDASDAIELPDPDDVSTWVATGVSIGPFEIGMSIEDDDREGLADESLRCHTAVGQDPWVLVSAFADGTVRSIQMFSDEMQDVYGLPQIASQGDLYDELGDPDIESWGPGGSPAWVIEEGQSALLAIGDRWDETRPVTFIVTDFRYDSGQGSEAWFPICYD
jgi:hypothetical protein